ncbi:hypothetical protein DFR58_12821 [Anaerobacterium chartisolvens]|uniref:Uncharacterized protein n=1 Tax=Anaerobacterium chartisolvens TaxID=1297424 RepID=A0A369AMA4_9FIRM|nr:hypothetical protein [Anaerobacterium chartisolvens]RCX10522.1 hypothetical protein DFR58_12821 [Anaerobacterium chartisolvens]
METTEDVSTKKCSFCKETVKMDWNRCPYCGSLLNTEEARMQQHTEDDPGLEEPQETVERQPEEIREPQAAQDNAVCFSSQPFNTPRGGFNGYIESPLSNGMKVFLTVLTSVVPGIGQITGLIVAIVFMNSDGAKHGEDKRSFGLALLIASLVMFILSCITCFILALAFSDSV